MTCFWDAILRQLRGDSEGARLLCGGAGAALPRTPSDLVATFKRRNVATAGLAWQGQELTSQQLEENQEWVRDYVIRDIGGGHLTSACDPFFCLLAHLARVRVEHAYTGHTVMYQPGGGPVRRVYRFRSSRGHMH